MLNEKELYIYETIYNFINKNSYSPTIRELCKLTNYKSTKTIYRYLNKLKENNYIDLKKHKKRCIIINNFIQEKVIVINTKEKINININSDNVVFQIKNNYFKDYYIKKNDYLIINTKKKIKNNDLGLFLINNKYRVMKYSFYDGYYILEDNEKEILSRINLIGVVENIYRNKI